MCLIVGDHFKTFINLLEVLVCNRSDINYKSGVKNVKKTA